MKITLSLSVGVHMWVICHSCKCGCSSFDVDSLSSSPHWPNSGVRAPFDKGYDRGCRSVAQKAAMTVQAASGFRSGGAR